MVKIFLVYQAAALKEQLTADQLWLIEPWVDFCHRYHRWHRLFTDLELPAGQIANAEIQRAITNIVIFL